MRDGIKVEVLRMNGSVIATWMVKLGGELAGIVTRKIDPGDGHPPTYRATYWANGEAHTCPEVFSGEFGNVEAVTMILDRARV